MSRAGFKIFAGRTTQRAWVLNLIPFGIDGEILERDDRVERASAAGGHDVARRTEREWLLAMEPNDRAAEPVMVGRHEGADAARGPAQVDVVNRGATTLIKRESVIAPVDRQNAGRVGVCADASAALKISAQVRNAGPAADKKDPSP